MLRKLLPLTALLSLLLASHGCTSLLRRQQGPQDKGGIFLVIAVKAGGDQLEQSISRTISVIESRCDQLAIYCKLERQGGDHVMLRVSSAMEPARIKDVLLSAGLEMRAVVSRPSPAPLDKYFTQAEAEEAAGPDKDVLLYTERTQGAPGGARNFIVVERAPLVTGEDIRDARAVSSASNNYYEVIFRLKPEGAYRLQSWTRSHIDSYIAIILNNEARSVAYIKSEISDTGVITGRYTKEQAEDIAHVLITGNLPAPVELVREGTYKP